ncbi:hypothetical protein COT65_00775 [Candidatus Shapirobacteria bacterium CG09_land_8_20_14_0_10_47_13]|uniref:tRNA/rRNA methyltransferase SpoU type domain-containing protein n=1 Tax=Candidatus Shapirobacteria bacterium CG09_land_8_20_14_0_10_47_13 TaxID=1974481 RepID=A0A2H0WN70_9BACT|nr:MAG: hypothetical protein COT65_00775 [Candidatus Shapirobacteria bacterium CG09_land_8_20_14_0_10_47_13]
MKLNAQQLRHLPESETVKKLMAGPRQPIYFLLENIYDTYNIGGLFRLADALNIAKIFLCGDMETPPNSKITKASIGTYKIVPWEYKRSAQEAIADLNLKLKIENLKLNCVAVEQSDQSIPYYKATYQLPLALIFGNETFGVLPATLKMAGQVVEIPMFGVNRSLNVIVSAAIVSYHAVMLK